jgi:hypothetical protein
MKIDSGPRPRFTPAPATSHGDQETVWRDDGGPVWFTVAETAGRIHRHPRTVLNWLSAYPQLPRRGGAIVRQRLKRKVIFVRGDAVHWLTEVVIFNDAWARRNPPSR